MGSNFLTKLIKMTNHSKELILKSVRESQWIIYDLIAENLKKLWKIKVANN